MIAVGLGILLLISIIAFIICVLVLTGNISDIKPPSVEYMGIAVAAMISGFLIIAIVVYGPLVVAAL
jgi:hypothetical protein